MLVSDNWIPLDSSYEAIVSRKLDAEHRHYVKPMRYDASASDVFPDFYLLDTRSDKPFPMEVFGMSTPAYLARKELKKAYYNQNMGPMDGGTGMLRRRLNTVNSLISRKLDDKINPNHNLKIGLKMAYILSMSEQVKLKAFLAAVLDDYKLGVISQQQAVGGSLAWLMLLRSVIRGKSA